MELNVFMSSIYESSGEAQVELIQMMRHHLEQTKNVIMGDLKRIFIMIHFLLDNATLKDLILESHNLIDTFITLLLTTELEQNLQLLWKALLINLADSDATIRKSTKRIFVNYIRKTRNVEAIARMLIEVGLRDDNFYIRERCLNLVPDAVAAEKNVLFSRSGLNDARRLLEAVIVHLNDTHQSVREQAIEVVRKLKEMNLENFDAAYKRLSVEHQLMFTKALESKPNNSSQQKFIQLNFEALKDDEQFVKSNALELSTFFNVDSQWQTSINDDIRGIKEWQNVRQIYRQFLTNEIKPGMSIEQMINLYPCDFISKLYFGFLRRDILQDCLNERDAMVREYGIRQLYETFFELDEDSWEQMVPEEAYKEESLNLQELDMFPNMKSTALEKVNSLGFMPQFFKFITYLLAREDNFKIINVILNIVNKIIQIPGIHVNTYLPLSFPGLVQLLCDERVVIRRRSLFLLRKLIKYLKKKQYLMNLMFFLDDIASDSSQQKNWHAKEELMNLISILILETMPNEDWFYEPKEARNVVKDLERSRRMQSNINKISQNVLDEIELSVSNITEEQKTPKNLIPTKMKFQKILVRISYFLDDPVAKVRQAALETLAVICNTDNKQEFLEILFQVLDQRIYDSLTDKIEQGRVYFINKNCNLEMPVVNIQKLEAERRAFSLQLEEFRLKAEELKEQRRLMELEDEERLRRGILQQSEIIPEVAQEPKDKHYKVTLYEQAGRNKIKFPLSQKDRVEKSNQLLDSLFANENFGIDSIKYDVIVPIGEIKVTQYRGAHMEAGEGVKVDALNSNIYLYKQKEEQKIDTFDYGEFAMKDEVQEEFGVIQYMTKPLRFRGHEPEARVEASKVRINEDIRSRVRHNITQLNEDRNVDLQIPKVIKANVGAYENYKYKDEGEQFDDDEEIFLDNKKLKYQGSLQKESIIQYSENDEVDSAGVIPSNGDYMKQQIQDKMDNQVHIYTNEQKYEKRLQEFLLTFENKHGDRYKGRNARKIKNKIKAQQQDEEPLSFMKQFPILSLHELNRPVESALAEITALILNLSVIDLELLYFSVSMLRRLLKSHLDVVYSSQVPLTQLINDLCRLLSPSRDNPIHKGQFQKYKESSSLVVRIIVVNVLNALSECALSFKRAIDPCVKLMFQSVAIWLKDESKPVCLQAEETMLEILKYCDDTQVSSNIYIKICEVMPRMYDKDSYISKIYVGVLLENLVLKWQHTIFRSPHFLQLIKIVSQMVSDHNFDVRRQGKKVYFKLLSLGGNLDILEQVFQGMNFYEAERMRDLIIKHNELEGDHQIGQKYGTIMQKRQDPHNQKEIHYADNYIKTIAEMSMVESQDFFEFGDYNPSQQKVKLYDNSFIRDNQNYQL